MSEGSEKAKELAAIKEYIEKKLEELREEIATLEKLKSIVDEELTKISFKKATEVKPAAPKIERPMPSADVGRARVLKSKTGEILARVLISPNELRFVIEPTINLTKDAKPFQSFLLRKVLDAMSKSDQERVDQGLIPPGHELTYEIIYDQDKVREIIVRNFREEYRLREIVNAVRWTLETVAGASR